METQRREPVDPAAFIRQNMRPAPVPSLPQLSLHTAHPGSRLQRIAAGDTPYWAYSWAGGLALAHYILDNPAAVAGRRVLDLGAGSGLVAIAAAKARARIVLAAETDPNGAAAIALNAALNGVDITVIARDILADEPPEVDAILVGDLFYAPDLSLRVLSFLDRCLGSGIDVLVGDPYRAHLPRDRLALVCDYAVADFGDAEASTTSAVFSLKPLEREAGSPIS